MKHLLSAKIDFVSIGVGKIILKNVDICVATGWLVFKNKNILCNLVITL